MEYVVLIIISICRFGFSAPLEKSSPPGRSLSTAVLTPLNGLGDTVDNAIGAITGSKALSIRFPDSGRKQAILEQKSLESFPIQMDDKYVNLLQFVNQFVTHKPIVDTIQEHEKYGNDGDHFRKVGTVLIGGFEGFSNVLNTVAELPFTTFRHVGRKITTSLNTIGGKLVGLS